MVKGRLEFIMLNIPSYNVILFKIAIYDIFAIILKLCPLQCNKEEQDFTGAGTG